MLIPDTCSLILVDTASSPNSTSASEVILNHVRRLIEVAKIIQVPVVMAHYPTDASAGVLSAVTSSSSSLQTFPLHAKPETWSSTDLGQAIAATNRNQVVIAGFWLEEAVTLLTLNCLSVGFDTYVVADATAVINASQEHTARARLTQAGAVPTSTEQIIREWAALLEDAPKTAEFIACIQSSAQN